MASAKAIAKIIDDWTLAAASGFRPIASSPLDPIIPMAMAGAIAPTPMAIAAAIDDNEVPSIILLLISFF